MGKRPFNTGPKRETGTKKILRKDLNFGSTLKEGWQECIDESSKEVYFWNESTNEVTWERPTSTWIHLPIDDLVISKKLLSDIEKKHPGFSEQWCRIIHYLSIESKSRSNISHIIRVQTKTRLEDWQDRGLSTAFFAQRVKEMAADIEASSSTDNREACSDTNMSVLLFLNNNTTVEPSIARTIFPDAGRLRVRRLDDKYLLVTFANMDMCSRAIGRAVKQEGQASEEWLILADKWFIRKLVEKDLEQPLFEVAFEELA